MEELICITILSNTNESEQDFSARLSRFWTHMLRTYKEDFEKVFAERSEFEEEDGILARDYLMEEEIVTLVERELQQAGLDYEPVDEEEKYTRYEAAPPEWMHIEH